MSYQWLSAAAKFPPTFDVNGGIFYVSDLKCFTDNNGLVLIDIPSMFYWSDINQWLLECEYNDVCYGQIQNRAGTRYVEFFYMEPADTPQTYQLAAENPKMICEEYLPVYIPEHTKNSIKNRRKV